MQFHWRWWTYAIIIIVTVGCCTSLPGWVVVVVDCQHTHAICDARSRTQCVTIYSLTDPKCGWFKKEIVTGKVNYKMENVQRRNK